jgi:DNA processing protein
MSSAEPWPNLSDEALVPRLRLMLIPGVGPKTRQALLDQFGSSEAVLRAAPSELRRVHGVGPKLTEKIVAADKIDVASEIAVCRKHGLGIIVEGDPRYPSNLQTIDDPPGVLFVRGELRPQDAVAIGIVGTRHPTQYGLRQAERLAASLARAGFTIVSGLARGIDAAAHRGAIQAGGRTIAVLGSGVLQIYPPEHNELADEVARHGAILSESPPRSEPLPGAFPQRNRIISGLSQGVLVIEAGQTSGALITARHAMEQGREVFALPGRIDDPSSRGCHRLIRDGAKLVESPDDVLEELGPLFKPALRDDGQVIHHPAELLLNPQEQRILQAIGSDPTPIDAVVTTTGIPVPQVLSTISVLEMRRVIRRVSGSLVARI